MELAQLKQVEALCETLYTGMPTTGENGEPITRNEAQQRLMSLQQSAEYIPQCQYILDNSQSQFAKLVATNSLTELITTHWNSFTIPQRIDIRNYVLSYLANNGPQLQDFVVTSLIKLVCRITKLGWFDDPVHRGLAEDVTKFLQATVDHCILGLKILNQLVDELNIPTSGRTLTQHRKTSVSFRDVSLLKVFQLGLTTLKQLQTRAITAEPQQEAVLGEQALALTERCLSFDFIGTNPDESTEDVGTIQAPTSWRSLLQDAATTELFFDFYANTPPPRSSKAMEVIILLASVRRSLFPSDKDRAEFLGRLITGIREMLSKQTGLQHQDNYHQFCRLLGRLKANYQLSELVKADGYMEWLELAASFTVQSIRNWQYSTNSIHYLLSLWGRLVAAVPYVRPETGAQGHVQHLEKQVLLVVETYIDSMLGSVETVLRSDGALEDPLEDEGSLKEQMDRLPVIARFQYAPVAQMILAKFDPLLDQYKNMISQLGNGPTSSAPADAQQSMLIVEGQLTWLTYMVGAIIGGHSWSSSHMGDGEETIDASLSRRALQLAQGIDFRLTSTNGIGRASAQLEQAVLFYFQNFRRVYMFMWDQMSGNGATPIAGESLSVGMIVAKLDSGPSTKQKVYQRMFDHLGMGDHTTVANIIVTKMGNNLKFWPEEQEIVGKTLELLHDMAGGYSSSKLLLTLETVRFLAMHHTEDQFPFLAIPSNVRHRTTFHATLTRLLLSPTGEEKLGMTFEQFLQPIVTVLGQLGSLSATELRNENCRRPLIGVFRDLRGIAASLHNRKTYSTLFDILHPQHLPLLAKVADVWYDQTDVIISLLRFLHEFCHNKANRVNFDQSSPNGILLFRYTSDVVCAYGRRLMAMPPPAAGDPEIYKKRYKGLSLSLHVLNSALGGNYVCFGVFELYNDRALESSLDVSLTMALSVPLDDINAYPKLSKAYFSFIEILFRNHKKTIFALDSTVFLQIMTTVHDGLQSSDPTISSFCANSIDHLTTYYFNNQGKEKVEMLNLNKHLAAQPNLFSSLMMTLFNLLLFGPPSNHWAVMRPMLSLILASESSFEAYKNYLLNTQSPENQVKLNETLNKLLADVSRSLDSANRDRFTQKLTAFRVTARAFLTI
ncbi:Importin-beta N-terminal domain containing protein [Nitzschia inconspicua]|uniref:Importin-beta N-terminal domain containing protein n=1 Tax=Nitzschia inconspicua TaxID=303405 RepID=A0A9K3L8T8_9STRA|nr:Importin-beta N-terminal domain containing protein [Nitzschia inconspicua]